MPEPTTTTVPFGGSLLLLCLADMPGATPKFMKPVLVRKRHAAIAYALCVYPTAATASFSVKYLLQKVNTAFKVCVPGIAGSRSNPATTGTTYRDTSSRHLATTMLRTYDRNAWI